MTEHPKSFTFKFRRAACVSSLIVFLSAVGVSSAYAVISGQLLWAKRYNGPTSNADEAMATVADSDGNVYVTGSSKGSAGFDYATVKYTGAGERKWVRRFNGLANGIDEAMAIVADSNDNIYVTGRSKGGAGFDYATVKYSAAGERRWVRRFNGFANGNDEAVAIVADSDDNIYVTGRSKGGAGFDYATVKYTSAGERKWVRRFNGSANGIDEAMAIVADSNDNIYVTGRSKGGAGFDYATVKYTGAGERKWVRRLSGDPDISWDLNMVANDIAVDHNDNIYITGNGGLIFTTVKYDPQGNVKWTQKYMPKGRGGWGSALAIDANNNIYVGGTSHDDNTSTDDYLLIKYGAAGDKKWMRRYDGPGHWWDDAKAVVIDSSNNVYITGVSESDDPRTQITRTSLDFATVKYDAAGDRKWVRRYNGSTDDVDWANAMTVTKSAVYVAGSSMDKDSGQGYATLKYAK